MHRETSDRRQFAKHLAIGATAALTLGTAASAAGSEQQEVPMGEKRKGAAAAPKPRHPAQLIVDVIHQRYADKRLDADVLKHIEAEVRGDLLRSKVLSAYPLHNWDEPGFVFAAWRADDVR